MYIGDSLLVRAPDSWSEGCGFQSRQERRENFLFLSQLGVLTLTWCPFHPRVTAVARKRPRSFCQNCRWHRLHLNTNTPLTRRSRSELTMPLYRHGVGTYRETSSHATRSSGNTQSQSSQLAEPLWTDSGQRVAH